MTQGDEDPSNVRGKLRVKEPTADSERLGALPTVRAAAL
jgi:hypothetical protein